MLTGKVRTNLIPSITICVRHSADCSRKGDDFYRNCKCPKHLRWSYGGRQFRRSAKTRTWTIAEQVRRDVEAQYKAADASEPIEQVAIRAETRKTIQQAVDLFVSDKRSQGISSGF